MNIKTLRRVNEIIATFPEITNNKKIADINELYSYSADQVAMLHFPYTVMKVSPEKIEAMFAEKGMMWEYGLWCGYKLQKYWGDIGLNFNEYVIQDFQIRIYKQKESNFVISVTPDDETKTLIDELRFKEQYNKKLDISDNIVDLLDIPRRYQEIIKFDVFFDDFSNGWVKVYEMGGNSEIDNYFKSQGLGDKFLINISW